MYIVSENGMCSVNTETCLGFKIRNKALYDGDSSAKWIVKAMTGCDPDDTIKLYTAYSNLEAHKMHLLILKFMEEKKELVCFIDQLMFSLNKPI